MVVVCCGGDGGLYGHLICIGARTRKGEGNTSERVHRVEE